MKKLLSIAALMMLAVPSFAQESFSIEQAWQYAVTNNVNAQKARIDQTIADQKVKETTGIGLPQVDLQGTYNYFLKIPVQLLPAEVFGGPKGTYMPVQFGQKQTASGGVTLTQLLFNGSYLVGLESAKTYKQTAALITEKTEISVMNGILMAYTGVVVTDENLRTLEENRKVAEKALRDTETTYKVGLIELQNVEQQQYGYKSLVTNQQNLVRTREQLAMALKYLMGYPMDRPINLTSGLPELVEKNEVLAAIDLNPDVSNHIDYRIGRNALTLSELQLKLQRSKYLPTLAGFFSSNYNGNSNKFTFFTNNQQWFNTSVVGLQLDVPVFSGFQRKWQTEQAKLNVTKAELDLQETQRRLKNSAYAASVEYENAYNSYKNAQELIALSSSIYKKEQIKFKEGMGSSFTLQQAETQLYDAQRMYYQAALNLIQSRNTLDEALGLSSAVFEPGSTVTDQASESAGSQQDRIHNDVRNNTKTVPTTESTPTVPTRN